MPLVSIIARLLSFKELMELLTTVITHVLQDNFIIKMVVARPLVTRLILIS